MNYIQIPALNLSNLWDHFLSSEVGSIAYAEVLLGN